MTHLFVLGDFTMHSGDTGHWKIECDALTDDDIECLAFMLSERLPEFPEACVHGIPRGGLRLAEALRKYATPGAIGDLIVDDVLTTGASMETKWRELKNSSYGIHGAVIFARDPCPSWITPLFSLSPTGQPYSLKELEITEEEAKSYPIRPDEVSTKGHR